MSKSTTTKIEIHQNFRPYALLIIAAHHWICIFPLSNHFWPILFVNIYYTWYHTTLGTHQKIPTMTMIAITSKFLVPFCLIPTVNPLSFWIFLLHCCLLPVLYTTTSYNRYCTLVATCTLQKGTRYVWYQVLVDPLHQTTTNVGRWQLWHQLQFFYVFGLFLWFKPLIIFQSFYTLQSTILVHYLIFNTYFSPFKE